jgi:hypothetical protein
VAGCGGANQCVCFRVWPRVFLLIVAARINVHECVMMCDVDWIGYGRDVEEQEGAVRLVCKYMHAE